MSVCDVNTQKDNNVFKSYEEKKIGEKYFCIIVAIPVWVTPC